MALLSMEHDEEQQARSDLPSDAADATDCFTKRHGSPSVPSSCTFFVQRPCILAPASVGKLQAPTPLREEPCVDVVVGGYTCLPDSRDCDLIFSNDDNNFVLSSDESDDENGFALYDRQDTNPSAEMLDDADSCDTRSVMSDESDGEDYGFDGVVESPPTSAGHGAIQFGLLPTEILGEGAEGVVLKAVDLETREVFAVKKAVLVGNTTDYEIHERTQMAEALCQLEPHPNIIQHYESSYIAEERTHYVKMQYVEGCSLTNLLLLPFGRGSADEKYPSPPARCVKGNERMIRTITRQIAKGLQFLHANGIIHRDIKGSNVMVDGAGNTKIVDMGFAVSIQRAHEQTLKFEGTPLFTAPETIGSPTCNPSVSAKSDVYSLGCTVIEMLTGAPPSYGFDTPAHQFSTLYLRGLSGRGPNLPKSVSSQCRDFLERCLDQDPSTRLSVTQCLEHPFLSEGVKHIFAHASHSQMLPRSSALISRSASLPQPPPLPQLWSLPQLR